MWLATHTKTSWCRLSSRTTLTVRRLRFRAVPTLRLPKPIRFAAAFLNRVNFVLSPNRPAADSRRSLCDCKPNPIGDAAITSTMFQQSRPAEEGLDELVGLEQGQVLGLSRRRRRTFTGRPTCWRIGDDHAPLGRAVDLGQHDARALHGLGKPAGLADAVLAGGGVEHQQHFVRRLGNLLADARGGSSSAPASGSAAFAAGRPCRRCRRRRLSRRPRQRRGGRRWPGRCPAAPVTISTPSRLAQIVSCSTAAARNVSPAPSTTFLPCALNMCASLAIEVVLPEPLTPPTMITVAPLAAKRIGASSWASSSLSLALIDRPACRPGARRGRGTACESRRRSLPAPTAHVGLDQHRPQLVEERVVDQPAFALEQVADVGVEQLRGLSQTLLELVEQAHGWHVGRTSRFAARRCIGRVLEAVEEPIDYGSGSESRFQVQGRASDLDWPWTWTFLFWCPARNRSRMPLTNWADWPLPKRLASSTASLMATRSGVSEYRIS